MTEPWQVRDRFVELRSRWLTVIGEHLQDDQNQLLEYWRVEKADSAIILPLQGDRLILPASAYRPGVGAATLDFPGGRVPEGISPAAIAPQILCRELGIPAGAIATLHSLNSDGWLVNSSFSNQQLFGFVATLTPETAIAPTHRTYPTTRDGIQSLLQALVCLQCRVVLLEWLREVR